MRVDDVQPPILTFWGLLLSKSSIHVLKLFSLSNTGHQNMAGFVSSRSLHFSLRNGQRWYMFKCLGKWQKISRSIPLSNINVIYSGLRPIDIFSIQVLWKSIQELLCNSADKPTNKYMDTGKITTSLVEVKFVNDCVFPSTSVRWMFSSFWQIMQQKRDAVGSVVWWWVRGCLHGSHMGFPMETRVCIFCVTRC